MAQSVQTLSAERSKSSTEPEEEPLEPASAGDTYLAGFDQGGVAVKVACPTCGTFRTDDQASMGVHQQGHKIDAQAKAIGEQGKQIETLAQAVVGLKESVDSQPGSMGAHFHSALEHYEQKHTHLNEVLAHADDDDCPECVRVKAEYDAKLLEQFNADQAVAETPPAEEPPAEEPAAEEPAPVVARVFEMDDVDHFKVSAYGMETVLDDETGKYTIKVKPGDDNAELAQEGIENGVVPENCVLRVGEDGKTSYVCDPERAPAAA